MEWLLVFALAVVAWWLLAAAADTRLGPRLAALIADAARTASARVASWAWTAWHRAHIRL